MDDRLDLVLADNLTHEVLIADVAENKWHSRGDSPVKASRQIVAALAPWAKSAGPLVEDQKKIG